MPHCRPVPSLAVLAAIACSCRSPTSTAIDPALASCLTPDTVLLAGLHLDRLRVSPLYRKLTPAMASLIEPLRNASSLLLASDGRNVVWIARGDFPAAPPGATLVNPNLAIAGQPESVRRAIDQHRTGATGAPDLLGHAAPIAGSAPVWAAVRGGIALPLAGNAANLNRLLRLVDYATLTVKLDSAIDLDLAGVCRSAPGASPDGAVEKLEETLRAIVSLAQAANPRLDALLRSSQIRREGSTVHVTLSADPDAVGKLIDDFTR